MNIEGLKLIMSITILTLILFIFAIGYRYLEEDDFKFIVVMGSLFLTITLITILLK